MSYKAAILRNENPFDHELWVKACINNILVSEFEVIDLTKNDWYENFLLNDYDIILLRPPGKSELFKRLYDERVFLLYSYFAEKIYPSLKEALIYENKRFLRDWLLLNKIPHPETFVFFDLQEAKIFLINRNEFPIVAKTNIGASGNGVQILNNKNEANKYLEKAFTVGIKPISVPKLKKGSIIKKIKKAITKKGFFKQRIKDYTDSSLTIQKGFVIFQEFIPHKYEWRCVKIGDSYFAHKKMAINNKSSGTLIMGYDKVPVVLLNFIKDITEKTILSSVAIDIFEKGNNYVVNEIQCFFGQSDPYQMLVDGKPGRYIFNNGKWIFEQGMFNTNQSYDLRLSHAISSIAKFNSS